MASRPRTEYEHAYSRIHPLTTESHRHTRPSDVGTEVYHSPSTPAGVSSYHHPSSVVGIDPQHASSSFRSHHSPKSTTRLGAHRSQSFSGSHCSSTGMTARYNSPLVTKLDARHSMPSSVGIGAHHSHSPTETRARYSSPTGAEGHPHHSMPSSVGIDAHRNQSSSGPHHSSKSSTDMGAHHRPASAAETGAYFNPSAGNVRADHKSNYTYEVVPPATLSPPLHRPYLPVGQDYRPLSEPGSNVYSAETLVSPHTSSVAENWSSKYFPGERHDVAGRNPNLVRSDSTVGLPPDWRKDRASTCARSSATFHSREPTFGGGSDTFGVSATVRTPRVESETTRNTSVAPPVFWIEKQELTAIENNVRQHPRNETGGDLFGSWVGDPLKGAARAQFALGPGQNCRRTEYSFFQDNSYLKRAGDMLIGQWHSHHCLRLDKPSTGDCQTVHATLEDWNRLHRKNHCDEVNHYVMCIATLDCGIEFKLFPYLFTRGTFKPVRMALQVVHEIVPLRSTPWIVKALTRGAEDKSAFDEIKELGRYFGGGDLCDNIHWTQEKSKNELISTVFRFLSGLPGILKFEGFKPRVKVTNEACYIFLFIAGACTEVCIRIPANFPGSQPQINGQILDFPGSSAKRLCRELKIALQLD